MFDEINKLMMKELSEQKQRRKECYKLVDKVFNPENSRLLQMRYIEINDKIQRVAHCLDILQFRTGYFEVDGYPETRLITENLNGEQVKKLLHALHNKLKEILGNADVSKPEPDKQISLLQ